MALALALYARGATSAAVRDKTSPSQVVGMSATERWITLSRWIESARRGALFGLAGLGDLSRRRVAERVMLVLAGRAGHSPGDDMAASAFAGALIAA